MAQNETVTRLEQIAAWIYDLDDVVTCTPNIDSTSVDFHLSSSHASDWLEQAEAIVETLDEQSLTTKNIGSFDTLDGDHFIIGSVGLFLPAYDGNGKIDHAAHFNAEER